MGVSGGGDRKDLRPHEPNRQKAKGTFRGSFEALNVRNAQPGFNYYYERRKPGEVLRRMNEGFEVVQAGDPEGWGADVPAAVGEMLDGVKAYGDLVLMRIREDKYRMMKEQKAALARAAIDGSTAEYLRKGHQRAQQLGRSRPKDDLYYKGPGHGISTDED